MTFSYNSTIFIYFKFLDDFSNLEREIRITNHRITTADNAIEKCLVDLEKSQVDLEKCEAEIQRLSDSNRDLHFHMSQKEEQIRILNQRLITAEENLEGTEDRLAEAQERLVTAEERLASTEDRQIEMNDWLKVLFDIVVEKKVRKVAMEQISLLSDEEEEIPATEGQSSSKSTGPVNTTVETTGPVGPVESTGLVGPVVSSGPVRPAVESMEPVKPVGPVDSMEPVGPVRPVDSTGPVNPSESTTVDEWEEKQDEAPPTTLLDVAVPLAGPQPDAGPSSSSSPSMLPPPTPLQPPNLTLQPPTPHSSQDPENVGANLLAVPVVVTSRARSRSRSPVPPFERRRSPRSKRVGDPLEEEPQAKKARED